MQELGLTDSSNFYPFTSRKQELGMKGHHVAGLLLPQENQHTSVLEDQGRTAVFPLD